MRIATLMVCSALVVSYARADVFTNVPEVNAEGFQLLYDLNLPVDGAFVDATPVPYTTDNSATAPSFDRVGYYLELTNGAGTQWVYVSAEAFTKSARELGLPHNVNNPVVFQQALRSMNVLSNVGTVPAGTGLATGRVEFWPSNYVANNLNDGGAASDTAFDFGDAGGNTSAGYGSFQIHRLGATPQTMFAYNHWGAMGNDDVGIGSNAAAGGNPDWTFAGNAGNYTARRLQVVIRPIPAKVALTAWPKYQQLFPRDRSTNSAVFHVAGTESQGGATAAIVRLYREGVPSGADLVQNLAYAGGSAAFDVAVTLPAERANYDVALFIRRAGTDYLVSRQQRLVAGDVLIIQGQSNADAQMYDGTANGYRDPFVRTFGFTGDAVPTGTATEWLVAQGDGARGAWNGVGQWGLVMGRTLSTSGNVPIAILNGAYGGQPISFFPRSNANPLDLSTNYGQLLFRARQAGVDQKIRAIMFYQGEAENDNGAVHEAGYTALQQFWREDYPSVERFYVCQLHNGCGVTQANVDLRDRQRRFADTLPMHTVMATNGINGHNGCHYSFTGGYEVHGMHMARLLGRDLYASGVTANVDAPNPDHLEWGNAERSVVRIVLRHANDPITIDPGAEMTFGVVGANVTVTAAQAAPGVITLTLSAPAPAATAITYTGSASGGGPSVVNGGGVGLLTFSADLPQPLKARFIAPARTQEVSPGTAVAIQVQATNSEGSVSRVEIFVDGQSLASTTASGNLSASWMPSAEGLYPLEVRAMDQNGVTVSATTRVLVASNVPPAGVGGLQIWLKATRGITANNDGLVSGWQDQSGMGNHAAQASVALDPKFQESVFGNLPGITFANNSYLTGMAGMPTGGYTKIIRHRVSDFAPLDNVFSSADNAPGAHAIYYGGNSAQPKMFHAGAFVTSSLNVSANADTYLAATYATGSKLGRLYLNGQLVGSGTAGSDNSSVTYQVGGFQNGNLLSGAISEVLVYDRTLTTADVTRVQQALEVRGFSPFERWQLDRFGDQDSSPTGDPDGDGVSNVIEYALGGDPLRADAAAILPHAERDAQGRAVFVFDRPVGYAQVGYAVEVATTLAGPWTSGPAVTAAPVVSASPRGAGFERVTVRALSPAVDGPSVFYRLRPQVNTGVGSRPSVATSFKR